MSLLALIAAHGTAEPPPPDPLEPVEPWPIHPDPPVAPTPVTLASDNFDGEGALNGRTLQAGTHTWAAGAEWSTVWDGGSSARCSGSSAGSFAIAGHLDQEYAVLSAEIHQQTATRAGVVLRYKDTDNHVRLDMVPAVGMELIEMVAGTPVVLWEQGGLGSFNAVTLDVYVDTVVITMHGNPTPPIALATGHDFAEHTGFGLYYEGGSGAAAQFDNLTVTSTGRVKLNWPRFHTLGTRTFPDIALGGSGAWDSTDINNPNVMPNPAGGWLMSYTGHRVNNVQDMGLAYASTLDGPWTKDPLNPAFVDPNGSQWNINGGLARSGNGVWVQSYGTLANAMTQGIATATTDLHDWTIRDTAGDGRDSTARTREDGAVEIYYKRDVAGAVGIWRSVSNDDGVTFVRDLGPIITPPWWFASGGGSFAEPGIWVPLGQEGREMILTVDRYKDGTRRETYMGITVDGGVTWQWSVANTGGAVGQGDASRFDSFMVYDGAGKFYLYYCGSDSETDTLFGGLQIGHRRIDWTPGATLVNS